MAAVLLQNRILLCEHAEQLRLKTEPKKVDNVPAEELIQHFAGTQELWTTIPLTVQIRIVFRLEMVSDVGFRA